MNECQTGTWVSFVDPVRSVSTEAICEPFAGNSQTPMSDGHIAVMTPRREPDASAIGMSVFVVADWLVVRPQTMNSATASHSGCAWISSPSGSMIVSSLAEMKVSAIHAIPKRATAATKPARSSGCSTTSDGLTRRTRMITSATVNITISITDRHADGDELALLVREGGTQAREETEEHDEERAGDEDPRCGLAALGHGVLDGVRSPR